MASFGASTCPTFLRSSNPGTCPYLLPWHLGSIFGSTQWGWHSENWGGGATSLIRIRKEEVWRLPIWEMSLDEFVVLLWFSLSWLVLYKCMVGHLVWSVIVYGCHVQKLLVVLFLCLKGRNLEVWWYLQRLQVLTCWGDASANQRVLKGGSAKLPWS